MISVKEKRLVFLPCRFWLPDVLKDGFTRRAYVFIMNSVHNVLLLPNTELQGTFSDQQTLKRCSRDYLPGFTVLL